MSLPADPPCPSSRLPAIVLAAGLSSRMGVFKPLLALQGKPLIVHVLDSLVGVASPILVVTGHNADQLRAALAGRDITFVHNPRYTVGEMLSSLRAGLDALPPQAPAFILAFADQPAVTSDTLRRLTQAWFAAAPAPPLILPSHLEKRGHPVVISVALIPEIRALSPDDSLRTVVHRHLDSTRLLPVDDPAVLYDVDTPEDFARLQARMASRPDTTPAANAESAIFNGGCHG